MKNLIIKMSATFLLGALIFSCSEEDGKEPLPSQVFMLKNKSVMYSLEESNLFLLVEDVEEDFGYRNYAITDGEHISGTNGDELTDYADATYFILFQLAAREDLIPANYIQHPSWDSEPGNYYTYLYSTSTEEKTFYTGTTDRSPMKISGGFDDGDIMKIQFRGELMYSRFDQSTGSAINTAEDVVFFFEGTVIDNR